jgi:radical SAM superfamily enzyme YgiQ (UPF0313 family)
MDELRVIMKALKDAFPRLERIGIYANGIDINAKSREELQELNRLGMGIVYLGLESGDDRVLRQVRKRDSSQEMIDAVIKAKESGIEVSVIVLLGLGGIEGSQRHAVASAQAVSSMNPHYLSALTLMVVPGTPLWDDLESGDFQLPSQQELLAELRLFLEHCQLNGCIFRTNHASNYLPLKGILNRDREALLNSIDIALQRPEMLRPEHMRGL